MFSEICTQLSPSPHRGGEKLNKGGERIIGRGEGGGELRQEEEERRGGKKEIMEKHGEAW